MTHAWSVVVVDDTAPIRQLVRLYVEETGDFEVVGEAADGRAAIDVVTEKQPHVVVLDLAMPVMDGLQALPLIREGAPSAHVIVLTGFGTDDTIAAARDAGAARFVDKGPDMGAALVAALQELMAEMSPAGDATGDDRSGTGHL